MKTFKVTTYHTVYIDNFEQGEGKQVNFYTIDSEQKAETIRQATEQHFNNTVYLPFEFDKADKNEDNTVMYWSNLVDADNNEPNKSEIEAWKKGEEELYSNNIEIMISEIVPLKFD
jgi:hypothetical protein